MLRKPICAGLLALSSVCVITVAGAGPFHDAIEKGNTAAVKQMLASGDVDLKATNKYGFLPLQIAVMYGRSTECELLIRSGEDVNEQDRAGGMTPMHVAAGKADVPRSVWRVLLDNGADPNIRDRYGRTPLHLLARAGDPQLAALLIASGARIDIRDDQGRTPLNIATLGGNQGMAKVLSGESVAATY